MDKDNVNPNAIVEFFGGSSNLIWILVIAVFVLFFFRGGFLLNE